jgi:hypothetical protein
MLLTAPSTRAQSENRLQLDATNLFQFRAPAQATERIALAESDLLCDDDNFEVDFDRVAALQRRLDPRSLDKSDLCRVDAAIVQSLRRCAYASPHEVDMLTGLMNNLAEGWRRWGDNDRVREHFRSAALLHERSSPESSLRTFVLQNWAKFEFRQGNLSLAASVVDRWVEASRYSYRWWPMERSSLIGALRTKAQILNMLGDRVGSRVAAAEAGDLAVLPEVSQCWVARTGEVECGAVWVELITRCKTDVLKVLRCYSERKR